MRLATWNVNSLTARLPFVTEWVQEHSPDVLCLQETKQADAAFPATVFADLGYETVHHGDGRWNGVAILSRVGLEDPCWASRRPRTTRAPGWSPPPAAGSGSTRSTCPTGGPWTREHYTGKLAWLARLAGYLRRGVRPGVTGGGVPGTSTWPPPTPTCGTPPHFAGSTHVSGPERQRPGGPRSTGA